MQHPVWRDWQHQSDGGVSSHDGRDEEQGRSQGGVLKQIRDPNVKRNNAAAHQHGDQQWQGRPQGMNFLAGFAFDKGLTHDQQPNVQRHVQEKNASGFAPGP